MEMQSGKGMMKSKLSLVECEEKQTNEYNALEAIYWDCKIVDLRKKSAWNTFTNLEFQISLGPLDGESNGKNFVGIDLYVKCPSNYPNIKPYTELKNVCGLDDCKVKELNCLINNLANELVGEVMIHDLCNCVRSFLHKNNKPPKESCYEEMIKSKQLKEQEVAAEKNRKEQEICHTEAHLAELIELEFKRKHDAFKKEKKFKIKPNEVDEIQSMYSNLKERQRLESTNSREDDIWNDIPIHLFDHSSGSRLQDDFETLEKIGHGGFGDVIKVQNRLDGRFYAIKRIPLNSHNKTMTRKIIREVKLLSRLNHENVVRYYNSWMETSMKEADVGTHQSPSIQHQHMKQDNVKEWGVFSHTFEDEEDDDDDDDEEDEDDDEDKEENDKSQHISLDNHNDSESVLFTMGDSQDIIASDDASQVAEQKNKLRKEKASKIQFLYIQMEFCEKSTLRDFIDNDLYKDSNLVWNLFREIVEGLIHIHDQGIIHRDLKPVNIFLDSNSHVKIGDFGLATVASDEIHQQQNTSLTPCHMNCDSSLTGNIGTALYVSPEILDNNKKQTYNQKVDLYSLGIIFFEMSYKPLQTGMERVKVLSQIRHPSIQLPPDVDQVIQTSQQKKVITWLLDHNPYNRPTARELLASDHFPLPPYEEQNLDRAIVAAVRNVNSHAHKNLMLTIFSQNTSAATEYAYDYLFTKGTNQLNIIKKNHLRNLTTRTLEKIFKKHGGLNLDVPLLMPNHKIYSESCSLVQLMNKYGGLVNLPYDSKIPFARFVEKRNLSSLKRYSIGKVFKESAIPELHPCEVWEASFDIVTSSPNNYTHTDVEILLLVQDVVQTFPGLSDKDFKLKINHSSLITAILMHCDVDKDFHQSIFLILNEYKNLEQQEANVVNRLVNIGLKEDVICKFLSMIAHEGALNEISSFLKCITKTKTNESCLVKGALNHLDKLLSTLEMCGFKFQSVVSLKLCNNLNIYSGMTFQISRSFKKKLDVLAIGGAYDGLLSQFRQLGNVAGNKKHVVGFNMSLEKLMVSMQSSMNETKLAFESVEVIIWNSQVKYNHVQVFNILQLLWSLNVSCKIYDNHEDNCPNVESVKLHCKVHHVPYLIILDKEIYVFKMDTDKERLIFKEYNETKFSDFIKKKLFNKDKDSPNIPINKNVNMNNVDELDGEDVPSVEVRLVGSASIYKQSNKIIASLKHVLTRFRKGLIYILLAEISKYTLKSIASSIELKDESSLTASINNICKEFQRERKYIQKIGDDIALLKFKNKQFPIIILYSLEDEVYKLLL